MLLKDKVIVVSGVGPGMGQAMAKIAAAEGAKVAMGARSKDFLDQVKAEIEGNGGEVIAMSTDVTNTEQCNALGKATLDKWGRIDGLINSAYMHGEWLPTNMANPDEFSDVFDVNCAGALRMAQACLPGMEKAGGGAIINVSTMSTVNPFPGEGAYSAGKGGLNALTKHMAKDFGSLGIRVNACRMGWIGGAPVWGHIEREVEAGRDRDEVVSEITDRIPIGVIPPEDDCAKAVLFFLSDYSKVVSGGSLDVNGGQYMAP